MTEGRDGADDDAPRPIDEGEEPRAAGAAEPAEPSEPAESSAAEPSEPVPSTEPPATAPTEPPTVGWVTGVQWEPVEPDQPAAPFEWVKLQIGSVLGRTLDTFVRRPLVFILFSIPSAVIGAVSLAFYGDPNNLGLVLPIFLVEFAIGVVFSLSMIIATDELRAGRDIAYSAVIGRALGRTVAAILSSLAQFVAYIGFFIAIVLVVAILAVIGGVGAALAAVVLIVAVVAFGFVVIRWMLSQPAIALDGFGPIQALNRSWSATRRNVWRLIGLYLLLGLLILPLPLGVGLLSFASGNDSLTLLLTGITGLIVTPLVAIAIATTYGDLTGRPMAEPEAGRSTRGRGLLVAAMIVVGVVGLAIAIPQVGPAIDNLAFGQVPVADRGKIVTGTVRNPLDPCKPSGVRDTFSSADTVYIGGYFTEAIPVGDSATVYFYVNGTLANSGPLSSASQQVACYYEQDGLTGVAPGTYKIVVDHAGETIAEGSFTVR
jgi:MFS family permease